MLIPPQLDSERESTKRLRVEGGKASVDHAATFWAQHLADAGLIALLGDAIDDHGRSDHGRRYSGDGRKIFSIAGSFTVDSSASDPHVRSSISLKDLWVGDMWLGILWNCAFSPVSI
ncbi:hypothetical protein OPT61_g1331 [Boeremia exigua]|uniref:Uncharacterized protein n=1 Tax=Boeremia exigua TaxID=749465 RepID=A0ACC2IQR4_9PLEO|nr:hypothetical protein OPT61_g1331 [Boeremia exigua]